MIRIRRPLLLPLFAWLTVGLLGLTAASRQAAAFPGMLRHGYTNCTSCHVAPAGGGALTSYGRGLSGEVLSTWAKEGEGQILWGLLSDKIPSPFAFGGDLRSLQTYVNTPRRVDATFFFMQGDIEVAANLDRWTAAVSLGLYGDDLEFNSIRHYLMARLDEEGVYQVRLGRFRPAYGHNVQEHTVATRRDLGFDVLYEPYAAEFSVLKEKWNLYLTALAGLPRVGTQSGRSSRSDQVERGLAGRASLFATPTLEVGLSSLWGVNKVGHRFLNGPFIVWGPFSRFYILSEVDFQSQVISGATASPGLFHYLRVNLEPLQGLNTFITQELSHADLRSSTGQLARWGAGIQWFPRPHFEVQGAWHLQRRLPEVALTHSAWLMAHYYW